MRQQAGLSSNSSCFVRNVYKHVRFSVQWNVWGGGAEWGGKVNQNIQQIKLIRERGINEILPHLVCWGVRLLVIKKCDSFVLSLSLFPTLFPPSLRLTVSNFQMLWYHHRAVLQTCSLSCSDVQNIWFCFLEIFLSSAPPHAFQFRAHICISLDWCKQAVYGVLGGNFLEGKLFLTFFFLHHLVTFLLHHSKSLNSMRYPMTHASRIPSFHNPLVSLLDCCGPSWWSPKYTAWQWNIITLPLSHYWAHCDGNLDRRMVHWENSWWWPCSPFTFNNNHKRTAPSFSELLGVRKLQNKSFLIG